MLKTVQLCIISIFLFTTTVALGDEVQITSQARSLISKLRSSDYTTMYDNQGLLFAQLNYTQRIIDFETLSPSIVFNLGSKGVQINRYGEFNGQCVSFVKLVTDRSNSTSQWRKGRQVTPNANIPSGTAIATFTNNGSYGSDGTGGAHTAILLNITSSYITVIDQNWREADLKKAQWGDSSNSGTMGAHRIYFNNNSAPLNAYKYHVIEL